MCAPTSPPAPGTFSPLQLDAATLRALADPGYVDAKAYAERCRQGGVSLATVAPLKPLPPMAHQKRRPSPQPQGGLPQVKSFY